MKRASLQLLPFLLLYVVLTFYHGWETRGNFRKDEPTYLLYSENLVHGHYAPDGTEFIWVGPGYPILLAPLVAVGLPKIWMMLLSPLFLYLALLFFYATLAAYVSSRRALWSTVLLGLYWPLWDELGFLMSEPLAICLVALSLNRMCVLFRGKEGTIQALLTGALSLAALAMTKVIFGYVITAGFVIWGVVSLLVPRPTFKRAWSLHSLALLCCLPWLSYTYSVTGKPFLWSIAGGMQLYWMSTPYEGEYGDWLNYVIIARNDASESSQFIQRHGELFRDALGYEGYYEKEDFGSFVRRLDAQQDKLLRAGAIENIQSNPLKYVRNWIANVSRMLFGTPFSPGGQETNPAKFAFLNGGLLLALIGTCMYVRRWCDQVGFLEFLPIITLAGVYFGASSLVSAYPRQFYILVPIFFWWIVVTGHYALEAKKTST